MSLRPSRIAAVLLIASVAAMIANCTQTMSAALNVPAYVGTLPAVHRGRRAYTGRHSRVSQSLHGLTEHRVSQRLSLALEGPHMAQLSVRPHINTIEKQVLSNPSQRRVREDCCKRFA
jgi:hypothetical protein